MNAPTEFAFIPQREACCQHGALEHSVHDIEADRFPREVLAPFRSSCAGRRFWRAGAHFGSDLPESPVPNGSPSWCVGGSLFASILRSWCDSARADWGISPVDNRIMTGQVVVVVGPRRGWPLRVSPRARDRRHAAFDRSPSGRSRLPGGSPSGRVVRARRHGARKRAW